MSGRKRDEQLSHRDLDNRKVAHSQESGSSHRLASADLESVPSLSVDVNVDVSESLAHGSVLPGRTNAASPAGRARPRTEDPGSTRALADDAPERRLGQTLGSYRILELIGKGGMGFVYRAEHTKLGREVALKLLRPEFAKRRDAVTRFFQEARTVNRIRHINIVDVTDLVELPDGTTFIIMELLHGESLGRWARRDPGQHRILSVLIQICEGLAAAHSVGIIHRDLKPDNVLIVSGPHGEELVKLLDFGVAKLVHREDDDVGLVTAEGALIGTPAFMSPEQAGGMAVDHRSDVYSVGAIMYELFCGQPMFKGRSFGEYVRKHLTEQPPRPSTTPGGAEIDPRLEAAVLRAIEKDPGLRFDHIQDLREVLAGLIAEDAGGAASSVRIPMAGAGASVAGSVSANADSEEHHRVAAARSTHQVRQVRRQSAVGWWLGVGVLAICVGAGGTYLALGIMGKSAGSGDADVATPPTPTVETILPPVVSTAHTVAITLTSEPAAQVVADGGTTLCTTPCTFSVEHREGEAAMRKFVLRATGFHDAVIDVPLTGTSVRPALVQLSPASGADASGAELRNPVRTQAASSRGELVDAAPATPAATPPAATPPTPIDKSQTLDPFKE